MVRMIFVVLILVQGCASSTLKPCSGVYSLKETGWYERQMKAAGARPLCATNSSHAERYRFVWLRSFDNPIIVTMTRTDREIELVGVRLDGAGGYKPGKIVEEKRASISNEEFSEFESYLRQMDFWGLKSEDELLEAEMKARTNLLEDTITRTDGAQWILEGADANRAHSVDRWSDVDGPFREAALFLLSKSGVDLNGPEY